MEQNNDKNNVRPQNKNLMPPIKKGETRNPNGRPKGQRNYATIYKEALIKLAELNKTTPESLENEMLSKGIKLAREGDYRFYKDLLDRLHGQPTKKVEFDGNVVIRGAKDVAQSLQGILNENNIQAEESDTSDSGDVLQE